MQVSNPGEELKIPNRYAQYRAEHPLPRATKPINGWTLVLSAVLIGLCVALIIGQNHPALPQLLPATAAPAPTPAPVVAVPSRLRSCHGLTPW
jgi:hypothetical protein